MRRCPICRARPATELAIDVPGIMHVKVCEPCQSKVHTGIKIAGLLKNFL